MTIRKKLNKAKITKALENLKKESGFLKTRNKKNKMLYKLYNEYLWAGFDWNETSSARKGRLIFPYKESLCNFINEYFTDSQSKDILCTYIMNKTDDKFARHLFDFVFKSIFNLTGELNRLMAVEKLLLELMDRESLGSVYGKYMFETTNLVDVYLGLIQKNNCYPTKETVLRILNPKRNNNHSIDKENRRVLTNKTNDYKFRILLLYGIYQKAENILKGIYHENTPLNDRVMYRGRAGHKNILDKAQNMFTIYKNLQSKWGIPLPIDKGFYDLIQTD